MLGRRLLSVAGEVGRATLFLGRALRLGVTPPFRHRVLFEQIQFIGARSVGIILLTSTFTGMVLVLQGYQALVRFGGGAFLGPLVSLSLVRELGPVLAALMVSARAGSAMAATLGTMRVTEQVDALEAMAIDPIQYLVSPRLLSALIALPILTALFDVAGIGAALVFGQLALGVDGGMFMSSVREAVGWSDVAAGFWKSLAFGGIIAWVSTYQGYHAGHGALGVGQATTRSVVLVSVLVLAVDYALTALLF
jgi:phospholipid/cholesterol/gamma-HCH transport system permease protein